MDCSGVRSSWLIWRNELGSGPGCALVAAVSLPRRDAALGFAEFGRVHRPPARPPGARGIGEAHFGQHRVARWPAGPFQATFIAHRVLGFQQPLVVHVVDRCGRAKQGLRVAANHRFARQIHQVQPGLVDHHQPALVVFDEQRRRVDFQQPGGEGQLGFQAVARLLAFGDVQRKTREAVQFAAVVGHRRHRHLQRALSALRLGNPQRQGGVSLRAAALNRASTAGRSCGAQKSARRWPSAASRGRPKGCQCWLTKPIRPWWSVRKNSSCHALHHDAQLPFAGGHVVLALAQSFLYRRMAYQAAPGGEWPWRRSVPMPARTHLQTHPAICAHSARTRA